MLGKIEGRRRGRQDEMVGWHHRLSGHEFEQALGDHEGQGSLAYHSPWGPKELDMTERLNWIQLMFYHKIVNTVPTGNHFIYNSLHLLVPNSHSIHSPLPFPLATTSVFSMPVSPQHTLWTLFVSPVSRPSSFSLGLMPACLGVCPHYFLHTSSSFWS